VITEKHAEECIGLAAYQFAGMGGVEQMLLNADLREMLFYMHIIVHLAIAFGTSALVLDVNTHAVIGMNVCFDVMHLDTFYNVFDVATQEMGYDCELESIYITSHPLIKEMLLYRENNGTKTRTPSVNQEKVKWGHTMYAMYYCLKPQYVGEHIQTFGRIAMYGLPYAMGYCYYFHFEANMKIQPDPLKLPEFVYDPYIDLQKIVFSDGKTFHDLLCANRTKFHPILFEHCQNTVLPNARTYIAVIYYDQLRQQKNLSAGEVVVRYMVPENYMLKNKVRSKL